MIFWVMKKPDGIMYKSCLFEKKKEAIYFMEYYEELPWNTLYKQGYRCVKVKIVEVE